MKKNNPYYLFLEGLLKDLRLTANGFQDKYQIRSFSTIMNKLKNDAGKKLHPETIGKILPIPTNIHYCSDSKTQIWLYNGDNLDLALNASNNAYLFKRKLTDKLLILGANLPGITGKKEGLVRIAKDVVDKQGFLSYGPYVDLDGGLYKIVIKYSAKSDNSDAVGTFDIGRFNVPPKDIVLYKVNLKVIEAGMVEAIIKIPNEGLQQVEFRTWFSGHGQLTVKSIEIEKL